MRELSKEEIDHVLTNVREGILALSDGKQPYCIPLAFIYVNDTVYISFFPKGRKWEVFQKNNLVCFNAFGWNSDGTGWISVIIDGEMTVVKDLGEIEDMVRGNIEKMGYNSDTYLQKRMEYYSRTIDKPEALKILKINISKIGGRRS
ncbi:pyridoxamine 5'-phosphate oxidase family protein [Spirochaetota bacterium]